MVLDRWERRYAILPVASLRRDRRPSPCQAEFAYVISSGLAVAASIRTGEVGMPVYGFVLFAITIFISSNIDGLLVLMTLFCIPSFHPKSVVYGQFISSIILILASLICSRLALWVPPGTIGYIGVFPLGLGLIRLFSGNGATPPCDTAASPGGKLTPSNILSVTLLTLSNGGDNLSVYIPVFAAHALPAVLAMACIFLLLTGVWCVLAYYLATHRYIGAPVRRYGQRLLPWVMIALGLYILSTTPVLHLLR